MPYRKMNNQPPTLVKPLMTAIAITSNEKYMANTISPRQNLR
jgi:hypothetical protein